MAISSDAALLDTNVIVYAYDTGSPRHEVCAALCERALKEPARFCITPQVLFEFLSVITRPERVSTPIPLADAMEEIEVLSDELPILRAPIDLHRLALALLRASGLSAKTIFDHVLAATVLAHGVSKVYTFDTGSFGRIPGVTVLRP